jgi:DNA-binding response OmpR family regulator
VDRWSLARNVRFVSRMAGRPCTDRGGGGAVARVMVVDDEPDVQRLIALVLRLDGHEVVETGRGEDLLALLRRMQPDALVLDADPPGRSGVEVALALVADPVTAGIGVVLTSAAAEITRRDAQVVGAAFVSKPFSPADVRARVADVVTRPGASARPV